MESTNQVLLKGNEAAIYGALLAGCECFFGYPITPASEIAHAAANLFPALDRPFLQAESEIAAINMVFGASASGRRAMTASSGLGISLKQEAVSFIATCELPAVIIDIMRGGPGLGNIGPEQSDYNQVVKGGGHGSYKCIVLAPNSAQEMCDMTYEAFDLADRYRTVVYVLTDGVIGQMLESLKLPEPLPRRPIPEWAIDGGVNKRDNYIASIYMDHDDLEAVNIRLQEKYALIEKEQQQAESYYTDDAELVIVCYGIISRVAKTAVAKLRDKGLKVGMLRPQKLFPFPKSHLNDLVNKECMKSFIAIEMSNGQMIDDVKLAIECKKPVHFYNRMGGNVPTVKEIIEKCEKILKEQQ
ncbi:3-methyl-2-oxobutanoate dehydrogenase subunit VorB [Lentisphaerota bacterium WC36G]|nr:3-methyl-2-oxobutanoate dehydrogenase subunit VorB [Lentisphaerae bacterium WC36]